MMVRRERKTYVIDTVWEQFLTIIKEEAGTRVVDTWFKAVSFRRWDRDAGTVYLEAPNSFVRDWIESNYATLIQTHLCRLLHVETLKILFVSSTQQAVEPVVKQEAPVRPEVRTDHFVPAKRSTSGQRGTVNKSYVFDTFVVGPSNSLACAAARAVTEKPGQLYNPLFFYGGSGLGKTHLLHAIGNEIKRRYSQCQVLYQTADRFVNEFIHAIRFDQVHKFQLRYKSIDVLLIDDIQFISNKEQTQEAFFHIFNTLYDLRKQIVFSSDTVPQDIRGLAERLRSRLAWGLVADIRIPSFETKIAILKKKAEVAGESLPDEVASYIASCVNSNIRELEGSLVRVMAFSSLTGQSLTLDLAKRVLVNARSFKEKMVDFEDIVGIVEKHYGVCIQELRSKNRNKDLAFARQLTMYLMKTMTEKSLRDIGMFLGGRDHSTVMHAINKIERKQIASTTFKEQLQRMSELIRTGTR